MAAITAAQVKELRDRTGAGMMECKRALVETDGDIEVAIENMRKSGQAKAAKKAGRIAAEGIIMVRSNGDNAIILEINSETDFVSRDEGFLAFANTVADVAIANKTANAEALKSTMLGGKSVEDTRLTLVNSIGENIQIRRVELLTAGEGQLASYLHGGRIGVIVAINGGDEVLAKDVAMHIAASNPEVVNPEQVPAELVEKEKEIFIAQAKESGKPDNIIEKMIGGKLKKFLGEVSLTGQPFVKDPSTTVGDLLNAKDATATAFVRFEVGEGIEKKEEDFAAEVMAQVKSK
ncbi:MAG: elongation factor Ts [Gammaproteobacteria bacterium]|nr:MAG: elongation factor Ts [Gammaproteobacteria bacterium]